MPLYLFSKYPALLSVLLLLSACDSRETGTADILPAPPAGSWKTFSGDSIGTHFGIDSLGMIFMYPPTSCIMAPVKPVVTVRSGWGLLKDKQ